MSTTQHILSKMTTAVEENTKKCPLHGSQKNPADLGYSSNSIGYSLYSPACNGCLKGKEDCKNGLWMSGFDKSDEKTDSQSSKDAEKEENK